MPNPFIWKCAAVIARFFLVFFGECKSAELQLKCTYFVTFSSHVCFLAQQLEPYFSIKVFFSPVFIKIYGFLFNQELR